MKLFLRIVKEIFIAIVLGLIVAAVAAIVFYKQIPFSKQIPESINYTNIDKNEYNVRGDGVEDEQNPTETFASKSSELRYYELIKYVLPGRHRPFGGVSGATDLPSEYVGQVYTPSTSDGESDLPLEEDAEVNANYDDPTAAMERGLQEQSYGEVDVSRLKQTEEIGTSNEQLEESSD